MQRQVWRDNQAGRFYVVEVERYDVRAAIGPVKLVQVENLLRDGFTPDEELTKSLAEDYSGFHRYEW